MKKLTEKEAIMEFYVGGFWGVTALGFSPDGKKIAAGTCGAVLVGDPDGELALLSFNGKNFRYLDYIIYRTDTVLNIDFSRDGKKILVGTIDNHNLTNISIYNIENEKLKKARWVFLKKVENGIVIAKFSYDQERVIAAVGSNFYIFSLKETDPYFGEPKILAKFEADSSIVSINFLNDKKIGIATIRGKILFFDLLSIEEKLEKIRKIREREIELKEDDVIGVFHEKSGIYLTSISLDGKLAVAGGKSIKILSLKSLQKARGEFIELDEKDVLGEFKYKLRVGISDLNFAPGGKKLIFSSGCELSSFGGWVKIISLEKIREGKFCELTAEDIIFEYTNGGILCAKFLPDGERIITGETGRVIRVFDLNQ